MMDFLERIIPQVGDRIGRYEIVEELGRGGFGVVYRAKQEGLSAFVAIKVLIPPLTAQEDRLEVVRRFEQEAAVIRELEHPSALKVRDIGHTSEGLPFMATEYVRGRTLSALLESGPIPADRTIRIASQVLGCLAEAHSKGIVHRDLKPDNLMVRDIVGDRDSVKVLDFGIAKVMADSGVKTQTGLRFGTPRYMAPEQAQGKATVDGRLDLYALGLILAECVSGSAVVRDTDMMAALMQHGSSEPLAFSEAVRNSPLFSIIERATSKNPAHRFADALAMRAALEELEGAVGTAEITPSGAHRSASGPLPTPAPISTPGLIAPAGGKPDAETLAAPSPAPIRATENEPPASPLLTVIMAVVGVVAIVTVIIAMVIGGDTGGDTGQSVVAVDASPEPDLREATPQQQSHPEPETEPETEPEPEPQPVAAEPDAEADTPADDSQPVGGQYGQGGGALGARTIGLGDNGFIDDETFIMGGMTREDIAGVVRSYRWELTECHEAALTDQPGLSGRILVSFGVDGGGNVYDARIAESGVDHDGLEGCLIRHLREWRFPYPSSPGSVMITYPFFFGSE